MSHLIDVVADVQQPDKPKDHEFGSYCFEELEPAKVLVIVSTEVIEVQVVTNKDRKCLLNSQESPKVGGIILNYEEKPLKKQRFYAENSKSSKPS